MNRRKRGTYHYDDIEYGDDGNQDYDDEDVPDVPHIPAEGEAVEHASKDPPELFMRNRPGYTVVDNVSRHNIAGMLIILYGHITEGIDASVIYAKPIQTGPTFKF